MITPDEALTRLESAEFSHLLSGSAAANVRRWLTEAPFAK